MSLLGLLKMTLIISVLLSVHKTWAFEFKTMFMEPYQRTQNLKESPNFPDNVNEYIQYMYSLGKPYKQRMNRKVFSSTSSEFDSNNRHSWKRNGDLINSLLGFPQDMMEAGR